MGEEKENGMLNFGDLYRNHGDRETARLVEIERDTRFEDATNIQFTSGTTGYPKGATLSHHNILNNAKYICDVLDYSPEERICVPVPLYHCFGMVIGNLGALTNGASVIYPSEGFDVMATLEAVQKHGATSVYGVPTMFVAMLEQQKKTPYDISSLKKGLMAGSICPEQLMKRIDDEMNGLKVSIAYGMTEMAPVTFQTTLSDPFHKKTTTVGRVHPFVESKVVDEQGSIVPRGEKGEVYFRGYNRMLGYWNDDEKTRESIDSQGWMRSGDQGTIDAEGYLQIVGRVKDMVIRGGENIYPIEVEEFLLTHPNISDA